MLTGAIVFTVFAVGIVAISAWWLFFSRLRTPHPTRTMSVPLAIALAAALGASAALMVGGALWDASMHVMTGLVPGGEDFLWPPHLMIYGGFLLAFAVGIAGIIVLAGSSRPAGGRDPRQWVRAYPMIGAVVLSSGYTLIAIPGDALWHELVGPDLTAWSPPHLAIAAAMTAVVLCGVGLLLHARRSRPPSAAITLGLYALLGLTLNILYTVGVLEWELPDGLLRMLAERPAWAYPVVAGAFGFFVFSLARFSTRDRMAATATALAFLAFRLLIGVLLASSGNIVPQTPLWFLPAALVVDLVPWRALRGRTLRDGAMAAGYSVAFILTALLALSGFLSLADALMGLVVLWLACFGLTVVARRAGSFLGGEKSSPSVSAALPASLGP